MPHSGNDGNIATGDGPGHDLFVKGPEILHGPAAPAGDDDVGQVVAVYIVQHGGDLLRRARSLDPDGTHQHPGQGPAPSQNADHVLHRRAGGRGDQGDRPGIPGEGLFPGGVKEALGRQLFLQLFKGHGQVPHPVGLHVGDIDLVLPALGEQAHPAREDDLHPRFRAEAETHGIRPEHHAGDDSPLVLEGEIVMPGGMDLVIGQLAPDTGLGQDLVPVQEELDILGQLCDRNRLKCHIFTSWKPK